MDNVKRCGARAPEALTGSLGPLFCSRDVSTVKRQHSGEHKAHKTIPKVGRINVQWKQDKHAGRQDVYRPEVVLPTKTNPELSHLRQNTWRNQVMCGCPEWKIGHQHIPPCPLSGS